MSLLPQQNAGPIFICGPSRSGKTYMRMMLEGSGHIVFSRRTNMWTTFYGRFGNLNNDDNLNRCIRAMMQRKLIRKLNPDLDQLRHEFQQGKRTYGRLFALFHEQLLTQMGKTRWGDQTELLEQCAPAVLAAYPNAKIIHMIRDPRDRFEALCTRDRRQRAFLGKATATWLYSEALARKHQQAFPDRYLVIAYESMVSQPEETMRVVCQFLGEKYTPELLTMAHEPRFWSESQSAALPTPLSTSYIGRFPTALSQQEIAFVQACTGKYMETYGYTSFPLQLTKLQTALFYSGTWLLQRAQMYVWQVLQLWRTRFHRQTPPSQEAAAQIVTGVNG